MPVEIEFARPPAGYSVSSARPGEQIAVQLAEFTSTDDGQHFIQRLEGLPDEILRRSSQIRPSQVDHMLAIIRHDGNATIYINELELVAQIRTSRIPAMAAGTRVTKNDIVDVDRLELGVSVPNDAGVLFLFSIGWRKGLFYDLAPIARVADRAPRQYNLPGVLGQAYCYVMFQERYSISDAEWDALFAAQWFPFSGLTHGTIDALVNHVRSGWNPDEKLDDIFTEINGKVRQMLDGWRCRPSFAPHLEILERAVDRFCDEDYISCTGLLFQRIEGILRSHHTCLNTELQPTPNNLSDSAVATRIDRSSCLLMPHRFRQYLRKVYFADFNPVAQKIDVSRHSVGHGVADASNFNQKSALIGILVVHQLFYFLEA
jgi:hypothetical protein